MLNAEQEVGPFYITGELLRANISEGKPGIPLRLRLLFVDQATCAPIPNAAIDLWHCDAMGLYSGYTQTHLGPPPGERGGPEGGPPNGPPPGFDPNHPGRPPGGFGGPDGMKPTDKLTFLRGIQITNATGAVEFATIFPGFYQGRTNHVHMKVRLGGRVSQSGEGHTYAAGHTAHVGQVFFPEDLNLRLMAQGPYAEHAIHRTTEAEDNIFNHQGGSACVATCVPLKPGDPAAGYLAELRIAVNPSATPAPVGPGAMGEPPPRG